MGECIARNTALSPRRRFLRLGCLNWLGADAMLNSPYGPKDVRRVSFKRLPKSIREASISMIERKLVTGTVTDLVTISDSDWHQACRRFNAILRLAEHPGRLGCRVEEIAKVFGATDRTVTGRPADCQFQILQSGLPALVHLGASGRLQHRIARGAE